MGADRNRSTDVLFSKLVRTRGHCECCGTTRDPLECAHIIKRRYLRTRWVQENAWSLCHFCHRNVDSSHRDFAELVEATIGWERYDELHALAHAIDTPKPDRVQIRKQLRAELNDLEAAL